VLADIRALLAALRDDPTVISALGESTKLEAEITAAVERVRAVGFSVLDSIDPDLDGINAVSRLTLLRVVQESLTNVMKYGDRHQDVEVTVERSGSRVMGRIASRGDATPGTGYGLVGMSERVELAAARCRRVRSTAPGWCRSGCPT
jgi:signal transduction histidine kinase